MGGRIVLAVFNCCEFAIDVFAKAPSVVSRCGARPIVSNRPAPSFDVQVGLVEVLVPDDVAKI